MFREVKNPMEEEILRLLWVKRDCHQIGRFSEKGRRAQLRESCMHTLEAFGDEELPLCWLIRSNFMDSNIILSLAPNVDFCYPSGKRLRVTAPSFIRGEGEMKTYGLLKKQQPCSIDVLPDECLFEILRWLPRSQTRSIAACVSKRWLMLLSSIQPSEDMQMVQKGSELLRFSRKPLPDLNYPVPLASDLNLDVGSDGYLSRCLEADEATDIRLAAITVCASGLGGLGKLKIRGNSTCKITDGGLSVIGRGCSFLRVLHIWKLPLISDAGLLSIANGCPMLENLDVCDCPWITDKGLVAIAQKCPNLISLSIDFCSRISNDGLQAVGRGCPKLLSISIKDCPLVGDKGISNLMICTASSLKKIKLENVNISDVSLAVIGHYGKAVTSISLTSLQKVNERGFWVMGNARNMASLTSCTISCCSGVTDRSLEAIAKGCPLLKQLGIRMSHDLSDAGLTSLAGFARTLESLLLEECNGITLGGVLDLLLKSYTRFRSLALVKCLGIRDLPFQVEELPTCTSLQSLTIRDSPGFTSTSLSALVKINPNLRQIDLSGLVGVTDTGLLSLAESSRCGLVKANLGECVNLSDVSISALVEAHGSSLKLLNLAGCKMVTDRSLLAISANCSVLKDLDVSRCSLSDFGVAAIASAKPLSLRTLSLAGCAGVTKRSLSFLGKMKESLEGLNLQQCKVIRTHGAGSLGEKLWWCEILS
ncbi:EIN3-binding F-box protein 1 [Platanthera zijinensis]|uniref:EIN3-binding F-box protein 1 n=1 Tax=Platanthera zijinensis TaxID=2320716 RepID=A0AAP0ASF6_9ASPA